MIRVLLSLLVLVALMTAHVAMAQDGGKMMGESMMEGSKMDEMMAGEFTAVISRGRARIRSGASLDSEINGFCQKGSRLTVWLPAAGDWLAASCQGVAGFIHSSLVDVGEAVTPAEDAMMDKAMMKDAMMDDGMMADKMMDDSMMKDSMMAGEFTAVISSGPARVRDGASLESPIVGLCAAGAKLTVWLPAAGDWLTASCHEVNGFIHNSLVEVGGHVIPTISDLGGSDEMAMKEDMAMDEM